MTTQLPNNPNNGSHPVTHHDLPTMDSLPEGAFMPNYQIGVPERTLDVVLDGGAKRRIYWQPALEDELLAGYAGWAHLRRGDETGNEYLDVPVNARRASTILGGVEAFDGEKNEIVTGITRYIARVSKDLHAVDLSLSFDSIGVDRGNNMMFAAPPHRLSNDPMQVSKWANNIYQDSALILEKDPRREELLDPIRAALSVLADEGLL
jgi:hypothetical protein